MPSSLYGGRSLRISSFSSSRASRSEFPRHDLQGARLPDQRPHLAVYLAARGVSVLLEAPADVPGLADVEYGALPVLEQVDRRRHGRIFDEALAEFPVELAHGVVVSTWYGRIYNVSTVHLRCMYA